MNRVMIEPTDILFFSNDILLYTRLSRQTERSFVVSNSGAILPSPTRSSPRSHPIYRPPCLPMPVTPPDKKGQLHGWWTVGQYLEYLRSPENGQPAKANPNE